MQTIQSDILIIGGGVAGLSLALHSAQQSLRVVILAKNELTEGSSLYAQGGIAAVLNPKDKFSAHCKDTHIAGAGLCKDSAVKHIVENAPKAINWLIEQGVDFTINEGKEYDGVDGDYHLTQEGGHSFRRIIHAKDATGKEVATTLETQVKQHHNIIIHENHIAIDLITQYHEKRGNCIQGAYALDIKNNIVHTFAANIVILATGGASKAYLYTTNPDTSTGDGIAMAWRAGCRVANMEFVQFHPTCLYHPYAKGSLISEAVRGEGGVLRLPSGERFMQKYHPKAELAPRDVVARAIDHEIKRHGIDSVFLDISHKGADFVAKHFPNINENCRQYGYDLGTQPIPVVPAAHYTCGGVLTDIEGKTDIHGLYVIGESACTGLHGANRLASNSLLECLVIAKSAATSINKEIQNTTNNIGNMPLWDESQVTHPDEQIVVSHNWDEIRRFMWDYVGIVRSNKRLKRAQDRINLLQEEIIEYYSHFKVNNDLIELRNLSTIAQLTIQCALLRKESRGLHYTLDYPEKSAVAIDTILTPKKFQHQHTIADWTY